MSKLKSDIILKYYKDNYFCNNGHNVYWTGSKYLSSPDLKCDKCGNINENTTPIRWSCEICKVHYCPECFKLTVDKYCPKKHKLKYVRQNQIDFLHAIIVLKNLNQKMVFYMIKNAILLSVLIVVMKVVMFPKFWKIKYK